jgi:hypothetical protein
MNIVVSVVVVVGVVVVVADRCTPRRLKTPVAVFVVKLIAQQNISAKNN